MVLIQSTIVHVTLRVCTDLLTQAQHYVTRAIARKIDDQERLLRDKQLGTIKSRSCYGNIIN